MLAYSQIAISPSSPVVNAGGSIKITADRPVTFSLSGTGSISGSVATSTTFKAPNIAPQHVLNGCMVLPSDSVFNTRIDSLPLDPNSSTYAPYLSVVGIWFDYQWGTNAIDNSVAAAPQTFFYTSAYNGTNFQIPTVNKKRENGTYATDGNNDHHVLSVNHQTCQFYETYQDGGGNPYCPTCTANSGYTYNSSSYSQPYDGTTDAAGLPLAPLTVHLSEILSGQINHALRFTTCLGCISNQSQWPATGSTGAQPGAPPMGARFRLQASFDITPYPPAVQVILRALQQYGMILADVGSEGHISLASDVTENPAIVQALNAVGGQIGYTNFEVVDETSLMVNGASHQVNPNNPYVKPANYASLTVIDAANPLNRVSVPIVIQPILIGTPDPVIVVQAGTPAFNIPYWVNNATNRAVTWSISPSTGAGTISSSGAYTAPATFNGLTQTATITATSAQDPSSSTSIQVTLVQPGQIRIDSGSSVSTYDDMGNVWLPDLGFETGSYSTENDYYGSNGEYNVMPNSLIWQTSMHTWGDDIVYRFHVPNGNYKIGIMNCMPNGSGTYDPTYTFDNGLDLGPVNLWGQQQIGAHNLDFGMLTNHQARTPATVYIPATVKDTNLMISMRVITNQFGHTMPFINGLTITPDTSTPHFSIDTQAQSTVPVGGTLQMYMINWYSKEVSYNWTMKRGSGTDSKGLFVAPATLAAPQLNQPYVTGNATSMTTQTNLTVTPAATPSMQKSAARKTVQLQFKRTN